MGVMSPITWAWAQSDHNEISLSPSPKLWWLHPQAQWYYPVLMVKSHQTSVERSQQPQNDAEKLHIWKICWKHHRSTILVSHFSASSFLGAVCTNIYIYDCVCIDGMWYTESLYVWYIYIYIIYNIYIIYILYIIYAWWLTPLRKWLIIPVLSRLTMRFGRFLRDCGLLSMEVESFRRAGFGRADVEGIMWKQRENHGKIMGFSRRFRKMPIYWDIAKFIGEWEKHRKNSAKLPCFSEITENHL